jgi:hypothetical protein
MQPNKNISTLQLQAHQVEHYKKILEILSKFYFYVDGSEMGTGKTYVAAAVAITLKLPTIVVCPVSVRKTWQDVFAKYGVPMYNIAGGPIITYESLRSKKNCQPKHGLLTRDDSGTSTVFEPTNLLTQLIQAGVLIIFDECQKLKNQGDQNKAAKAIIKQFYAQGGASRIGLLSGSAIDKQEQTINLLKMVGFINSRNLYSKINGELRLEGIQDLYDWSRRINDAGTTNFIASNAAPSNREKAVGHVFDLFVSVIKPGVMSIMPRPDYKGSEKDLKNGFYVLSMEDDIEYQKGVTQLAEAVRYHPETGSVIFESMGAIQNALVRIQSAKMRTMARLAHEELAKQPVNQNGERLYPKIILYADYYEVINSLLQEFAKYNPMEYTGRLSEKVRNSNLAKFQEFNNDSRIFIGNPFVGSNGINLHDTDGHFPRIMYIMPGYRINELHQVTGRIFRTGIVGSVKIRFVYGLSSSNIKENSILDALSRKGETMKSVHSEQSEYGMKFINELLEEHEYNSPLVTNDSSISSQNSHQTLVTQVTNQMKNVTLTVW